MKTLQTILFLSMMTLRVSATELDSYKVTDTIIVNLGSDTSICERSSIVLSVDSGNYHYLWSTGDSTHYTIVQDSGYYWLNVYDQNLMFIGSDTIKIGINQLPDVSFDAIFYDTIPNTMMFFAVIKPGNMYFWDFGDGKTSIQPNPVHTFETPSLYFVKLKIIYYPTNCSDSLVRAIITYPYGILNSNLNVNKLNVEPSPFQNNTIISFELMNTNQNISLVVYDPLGRKIKSLIQNENFVNGTYKIPFESINEKGLMYVVLTVDNQPNRFKMICLD